MLARALILAVLVLAGCSHATLPYRPDPQPHGGRVSADYRIAGDRLRVELDTSGHRLEQAWIVKPDGTSVAAQSVDMPPLVTTPGPSISIGVGGASYGRGIGVGSGVGVGVPVGSGSTRVEGNTGVWFPLAEAGPAPWRLYVKCAGVDATTFDIGYPAR
ncbi:MAG TPA: hypothetical protein VFL90_19800 [Methylomirabilota bacterium]|nr:hypothetical protein [Methylomirabilota bacterium]